MKILFSRIFLFLFLSISCLAAIGQGVRDLRFSEVLVKNETNCVDEYGVRSGWFEIYNTGYAVANIGGCYLTNDMNNPKKYRVPKGDPTTQMSSQTYVLFFAYDNMDRGVFHVNFSLDETGFLALFDAGGVLLDSLSYDINAQKPDISFGKMENEPIATATWKTIENPTPKFINYTVIEKTRGEKYSETDRYGVIITITTMTVVFLMLTLLALIFTYTGRYFKKQARKDKTKETKKQQQTEKEPVINTSPTADTDMIAIAMALHLHFDNQHEIEQTGFWLKPQRSGQLAWASKNSFKRVPNRK